MQSGRDSSQVLVENRIISTDIREMFKYQMSFKSVQWESSCSVQTDGQMER